MVTVLSTVEEPKHRLPAQTDTRNSLESLMVSIPNYKYKLQKKIINIYYRYVYICSGIIKHKRPFSSKENLNRKQTQLSCYKIFSLVLTNQAHPYFSVQSWKTAKLNINFCLWIEELFCQSRFSTIYVVGIFIEWDRDQPNYYERNQFCAVIDAKDTSRGMFS